MLVQARLDEPSPLLEVADDLLRCLDGGEAVEPAVVVVEPARLVDRGQHREVVHAREVEVLGAAARGDVDDPGAVLEGHVVPRDHAVLDGRGGRELVERALVPQPDEVGAAAALGERRVRIARDRDPVAVLTQAVLGVGLDRRSDVRGERPRRRRPDHERLARVVEQREAHEERGIGPVDVAADELVGRNRRAAARAPLGRAVAEVEPALPVDVAEEAPDVLDVRVAEGEVVVAPVHPLPEADRALGQRARGLDDDIPAPAGELGEAELLDLLLRVEPELPLDADLDPEALAVEAVLVALVVAAQRLVALEDVLQRPPPGRVDSEHHPVRGHRAVDEAEPGAAPVLLPEAFERLLALPELEDLELERGMVGLVRKAA